MTDSLGIEVVANPENGMWTESDRWRLEENLRIGALEGDFQYQFGQIGTIAVNSRGEILVSDRQAGEVRVFSKSGEFIRAMGQPGSGPGELGRAASDVLITAGDTVLVPDRTNRRITRFGPAGEDLPSAPLDVSRERALRFSMNPSMSAIAVQVRPLQSESESELPAQDAIRVVESSGAFGETLLEIPSGGLFQGSGLRYFTPEPMWDITDSLTVMYGMNSEYRIGVYRRDGSLQRIITRSFDPRLLTDRDIRAFFAYLDRAWTDAGVPRSRLAANHRLVSFAEFLPAYASLHAGPDGSLWVQPVQAPGELTDAEIDRYNFLEDFGALGWEVFDGLGRYLGVLNMPVRFQPRLFVADEIYGVWRDELDVQHLMRLRIIGEE